MTFLFNPLFLTTILITFIINAEEKKATASPKSNFNYPIIDHNLPYSKDLTKIEKSDREIETLEKALEVANSLKDVQAQQELLIKIAQKYAEIGEKKKAIKILNQSLVTIQSLDNLNQKTELMLAVSQAYENLGKSKIANKILEKTVILVSNLEDELIQAQRLTEIALRQPQKSADILLTESQTLIAKASKPVSLFPFQPTPLNGSISFFGSIESALNTTNEVTINLGLEQTWKYDEFAFRGLFSTDFDSARVVDRDQTTIDLTGEYRHHFDETWKFFTYNTFLRDQENNINYDLNLIAGPGINIFRKYPNRRLDMGVGLGARYEDSLGKPDDTNFPTVSYLISYRDIFFERLNYRQLFIYNLPVEDTVDSRILAISELSWPLFENWSLTGRLQYIYLGVPPDNKPTSEINFSTGLTYDF
ncbi:DUF481 domain-containing protein [Crocosphaera chwakensis]|uniref:DUF481 domain-containing protein n=1 Tax=Crocosphaera chwakensis CCY0110 TaxID=391612 RepID=A3IH91_9CHRO|nr:DUF481 domain-containing protein [Crocosphaera chwakensis]EAZ94333.1 hypothetical protein CY0110_10672 [Crocosphaera chwakensis CCY0110]